MDCFAMCPLQDRVWLFSPSSGRRTDGKSPTQVETFPVRLSQHHHHHPKVMQTAAAQKGLTHAAGIHPHPRHDTIMLA